MKTFMKFLPILLLVAAAYSRTISTKAPDFPAVQMTLATHPSVHALVAALEKTNPTMPEHMSYSVLLKNDSPHKIVAYTIRWSFVDANGKTGGVNKNYLNLTGTDNGIEIPAGATQLVTPMWSKRCCTAGVSRFSPKGAAAMTARFAEQQAISISLDLVIYDDGEVVGPDEGKTGDYVSALQKAQRELSSMVLVNDRHGVSIDVTKDALKQASATSGNSLTDQARPNTAMHLLSAAERGRDSLVAEATKWAKYPALTIHKGESK